MRICQMDLDEQLAKKGHFLLMANSRMVSSMDTWDILNKMVRSVKENTKMVNTKKLFEKSNAM